VAAGFDGEGGVEVGEDLDCFGDIVGGGGGHEAGWFDFGLAGRPVAALVGVVGGRVGEGYEVGEGRGKGLTLVGFVKGVWMGGTRGLTALVVVV
jgi:hypothetical protein